jgi:hypothetical protein
MLVGSPAPNSFKRSVPEASRPREQVENHERACTQVLFQAVLYYIKEIYGGHVHHTNIIFDCETCTNLHGIMSWVRWISLSV